MSRRSRSPGVKRTHDFVDEVGHTSFGATLVRYALVAVCNTMETESPRDGLTWLTIEGEGLPRRGKGADHKTMTFFSTANRPTASSQGTVAKPDKL